MSQLIPLSLPPHYKHQTDSKSIPPNNTIDSKSSPPIKSLNSNNNLQNDENNNNIKEDLKNSTTTENNKGNAAAVVPNRLRASSSIPIFCGSKNKISNSLNWDGTVIRKIKSQPVIPTWDKSPYNPGIILDETDEKLLNSVTTPAESKRHSGIPNSDLENYDIDGENDATIQSISEVMNAVKNLKSRSRGKSIISEVINKSSEGSDIFGAIKISEESPPNSEREDWEEITAPGSSREKRRRQSEGQDISEEMYQKRLMRAKAKRKASKLPTTPHVHKKKGSKKSFEELMSLKVPPVPNYIPTPPDSIDDKSLSPLASPKTLILPKSVTSNSKSNSLSALSPKLSPKKTKIKKVSNESLPKIDFKKPSPLKKRISAPIIIKPIAHSAVYQKLRAERLKSIMNFPEPNLDLFPQHNTTDIQWLDEDEKGEKNVLAISTDLLLQSLIDPEQYPEWRRSILLIFRIFISANDLVNLLKENLKNNPERFSPVISIIVNLWAICNPCDFEDEEIFREINSLIDEFDGEMKSDLEKCWINEISTFRAVLQPYTAGPKSIIPKEMNVHSFSILEFHPLEVARQMSLIDHRLFASIPNTEFINRAFDKPETSPNLHKIFNRFNQVTNWIATEITMEANIKQRVKLVSHFILIGVKLLSLRNFAGLMSVFIGLTQFCVSRMQLTWKSLPQHLMDKWNRIEVLCSPGMNFKNLRQCHENCALPAVKSTSLFLKDIVIIDENQTYLNFETQEGSTFKLWNIHKFQQLSKLLKSISDAQRKPYELNTVFALQNFLEKVQARDISTCEDFSLKNEPSSSL